MILRLEIMSKKPTFEVTHKANLSTRYVIFTKYLNNIDFKIDSKSCLGGIRILNMQIPRKVDKEGKQDMNAFAFEVENESDLEKINIGDVLEIT